MTPFLAAQAADPFDPGAIRVNHLVRCRGGEWILARDQHGFGVGIPATRGFYRACWNGTSEEPGHKIWNGPWWDDPTWIPVAWLCCEVDPAEGPKFAAAILDAGPGDDAPALIAAEWLEERGARGKNWDGKGPWPEDWTSKIHYPIGPDGGGPEAPWHWVYRGPLASWARHLIDTRCVACGGRRDGEDNIEARPPSHLYGRRSTVARRHARQVGPGVPADCPLCGFPAHPTPPALAIPEVVK